MSWALPPRVWMTRSEEPSSGFDATVTADVDTILVVAAEGRELAGLIRRCERLMRLPWPLRFARAGRLNGRSLVMVAGGAGPRLAGRAMETAGCYMKFDALVSAGTCGALDPALSAGDVFVATHVDAPGGGCYPARLPGCDRRHATGRLVSIDRVVRTAEEKRKLRKDGAGAVEMEACAVAVQAGKWDIPLFCIKAVLDESHEELLLDYNAARDTDGRITTPHILAAAVRRPLRFGPELWKLRCRSRNAAAVLGDFLANCRF